MRLRIIQFLSAIALFAMAVPAGIAQNSSHAGGEPIKVAGNWIVSTEEHHGPGKRNMTLQQDGNKVSGSIQGEQGDDKLQGELDGNSIRFTVHSNTHHGATTFEYRGTVQGDSMNGTIQGPKGEAKWSAIRKAE